MVIALRSDFEPRLAASPALGELLADARYLVPAMTSEEFRARDRAAGPAKALYFEPAASVGELVDEVLAMPGGPAPALLRPRPRCTARPSSGAGRPARSTAR